MAEILQTLAFFFVLLKSIKKKMTLTLTKWISIQSTHSMHIEDYILEFENKITLSLAYLLRGLNFFSQTFVNLTKPLFYYSHFEANNFC